MLLSQITSQIQKNWRDGLSEVREDEKLVPLGTNTQLSSHLGRHSARGHWRRGKNCPDRVQRSYNAPVSSTKGLPKEGVD